MHNAITAVEMPNDLAIVANENLQKLKQAVETQDMQWPSLENFDENVTKLFCGSLFIVRFAIRFPEILIGEQALQNLGCSMTIDDYRQSVGAVIDEASSETQLMSGLRILRQQEMLRITWRDLLGVAGTTETLCNLTEFAEACIDLTLKRCYQDLSERFGVPRNADGVEQVPVVLGMGKLGGMELNYSSDIDLIVTFAESGLTDGRKELDITDFYRRVIQKFVRLLNESTAEGFVFRVDLRLRPFGASGPMAMSFDAMEAYYQTQGREWERYAMIKARVVSGSPELAEQLFSFLRPFVFRRYLDYSAFESLRDLKAQISQQVARKGMQGNVKLGAGGIREIEFIGQAFQLVRAGKETELQEKGIVKVLGLLSEKNHLAKEEVADLHAAYDFLRRTENRLQMVQDQQTHELPTQKLEQSRLAYSMGFSDWAAFLTQLESYRAKVQAVFEAVFRLDNDEAQNVPDQDSFALLWSGELSVEQAQEELTSVGYRESDDIYKHIQQLNQGGYYSRLTKIAKDRLDKIVPALLRVAVNTENPDLAVLRMLGLLRNIAGRSVYVQVLLERPESLELLCRLYSSSKWLSEFVNSHPMVIDEILDHRLLQNVPDVAAITSEMQTILKRIKDAGLDVKMDAVRQFKQANVMRVAAADLEGLLPLKEVSNRLTAIAEVVLQASCELVWAEMLKKHGRPTYSNNGELHFPGFAVVAYGKMGGLELGYGSDLDIVFLHSSDGSKQQTEGPKVIENGLFFARMAQKVLSFLNTMTGAGTLYEIDTRLRPNGQSGMLVSSLASFEHYQQSDAWTWEHQALVRARMVVGDVTLRHGFDKIRHATLGVERDPASLLKDVVEMRERMFGELNKAREGQFDLKQGRGGIVDIEFMVQYSVLARGHEFPELLEWTDNLRVLETLAAADCMDEPDVQNAIDGYFLYREYTHKQALQGVKTPVLIDERLASSIAAIQDTWARVMSVA